MTPKAKLLFLAILIAVALNLLLYLIGIRFPYGGGYYLQAIFITAIAVGLYGLLIAISEKVRHKTENKKS